MQGRGETVQGVEAEELAPDYQEGTEELDEDFEYADEEYEDDDDDDDEELDDDEDEDEDAEPETVRETVERALEEEREKLTREESGEQEAPKERRPGRQKRPGRQSPEQVEELRPPQRLSAQQKQIFEKLPPEIRQATHEMFKNHEGALTRAQQQAAHAQRDAQHIVEAVRPYLNAHPELLESGYTESRIVGSLMAAHQRLTDPKTSMAAYMDLGRQIGVPAEVLENIRSHAPAQAQGVSSDPEFQAVKTELNALKSEREAAVQAQTQANVQSIVAEIDSLRHQKDASGNYLYPLLHNGDFLQQAKPLVSALKQSSPGISYSEAMKRAYFSLTGELNQATQAARLPTQGTTNGNNRAQSAAVSVRGKSAPAPLGEVDMDKIPDSALETPADTARWALKQLRGG